MKIIVFSIFSYSLYAVGELIFAKVSCSVIDVSILNTLLSDRSSVGIKEITGATAAAFLLSILLSYSLKYNWLH